MRVKIIKEVFDMKKKSTEYLNKKVFYVGKMWDQTEENQVFYIRKNDDVAGASHWHDCFEIEFIIEGSCTEVLNGVGRDVKRGDITLITPTDLHEVRNIDSLVIYNMMFAAETIDNEILNTILLKSANTFSWSLSDRDFAYALNILEYADTEFRQKNKNYERFMIDTINQLLTIILRMSDTEISERKELSMRSAALYIRMNFKRNPTLEDVAQAVNLNPAYFSVKFHEIMGVSYKEYLNDIKLNFASKALKNNREMSVSEICYESGFGSLSHFHREFKEKFGCTPLEFRRKQ